MKLLRTLTVSLVIVAPVCYADTIASMPNESGGKIVLTDEKCTRNGKIYEGLARAYTYSGTGLNVEGCYIVEDDTALIAWLNPDGTVSKNRYKLEYFTLPQQQQPKPKYRT